MASRVSTMFLSPEPNKLCNKLKLVLLEKQAGNKSDTIDEGMNAIAYKLLE